MYSKIIMPELTASAKSGTVRKWLKKEGEIVSAGEILCNVMAGKTTAGIECPAAGVLLAVTAPDGSIVKWDGILGFIGEAGEQVSQEDLDAAKNSLVMKEVKAGPAAAKKDAGPVPSVLVIGGGPGGYVAAIRAAQLGSQVTVVERQKMGGTCLNVGCIPTKAIIHSGQLYQDILHGSQVGIRADQVSVDWQQVQDHKWEVTDNLTNGVEELMKANGIRRIRGTAEFLSAEEVLVKTEDGEEKIRADRYIIATGSEPAIPDVPGYRELENCVDSTGALNFDHIPESMAVVGAGTIGVELACAYASFGTDVTVLVRSDVILRGMDRELTEMARAEMEKNGVKFLFHTTVESAEASGDGVLLHVQTNGEAGELRAEKVLIASGRRARLEGFGLENTGVEVERGFIKVDSKLRTSVPHIFAIGDCANPIMMAHTASAMGETAADNALGKNMSFDAKSNPSCVFISPEFAGVGLTEEAASAKGAYRVGRFPMNANGKSLIAGKPAGMVKVIADEKGQQILGIHILAEHASDMIAEAALAIQMRLPVNSIINTIHPHPTISEAVREAVMDVKERAVNKI